MRHLAGDGTQSGASGTMSHPSIPPGFAQHSRASPLTAPWEPILSRLVDERVLQLGVIVREAHCNARGFAHGGLISALADNAMGHSAVATARKTLPEPPASAVTVNLSLDFADSARIGEWLEVRPVVLKMGRTLAFTEGHVIAMREGEERLIARCSATFRMVGGSKP